MWRHGVLAGRQIRRQVGAHIDIVRAAGGPIAQIDWQLHHVRLRSVEHQEDRPSGQRRGNARVSDPDRHARLFPGHLHLWQHNLLDE